MIETNITNAIDEMNTRTSDASHYGVPGGQPHFHDVLSTKVQAVGVPDPLSVAAPSLTFFVLQNADGSRSYSRAGNFQVRDGNLLSSDGRQVLGYPVGRDQGSLVPLTLPAGTPDGWVNISTDGTLSVADPKVLAAKDLGNSFLAKTLNGVGSTAQLPRDGDYALQQKSIQVANQSDVLAASRATLDPVGASGIMHDHQSMARFMPNQEQTLTPTSLQAGSVAQAQAAMPGQSQAATDAADRAADVAADKAAAANPGHIHTVPGSLSGSSAPAFGQPVGRLALARFGLGTIVDDNGAPTSRVPAELGIAKSGGIGALRTNSRDLGNVDLLRATREIAASSERLTAVMTAEQSRLSRMKKAMDLIK